MMFGISRYRILGSAALLVVAAACGGDDNGGEENPTVEVAVEDGNSQTATVGTALAPYTALVSDNNGDPVSGVTVTWSVQSGGGSVAPTTAVSDADGLATTVATLGTTAGAQVVRASITNSTANFTSTGNAGPATAIEIESGNGQRAAKNAGLPASIHAQVTDDFGNAVPGATVAWNVDPGNGTVSAPTSVSNASGVAFINWTLGGTAGAMRLRAALTGVDSVQFTATAGSPFSVLGGGNNVPERRTSDLWLADGWGYTGTWGVNNPPGAAVKIWQLDGNGAPVLRDSIVIAGLSTVSDLEVSPDGKWLVFTGENGANRGIHVYELTTPGTAVFRAKNTSFNLHTGALSVIGGKLYAFTAKDPSNCALVIYDVSTAAAGTLNSVSSTPIPDNYCIHDTFVRDGYAFVFAWNEGLYIYDVGNGSRGGTPAVPALVSHTSGFGGETHNGWWFWNPNGEKKYLFIGEEGPGIVGSSSSGDLHVIDVSNLAAPVEVASYRVNGAGAHNFWVDESRQILYAAFYNGGVVALDISGTLSGNLANREIARLQHGGGGGNTYAWGVMLYNSSLYVSDMVSGFWQLGVP